MFAPRALRGVFGFGASIGGDFNSPETHIDWACGARLETVLNLQVANPSWASRGRVFVLPLRFEFLHT
jgi:hypothetical protein